MATVKGVWMFNDEIAYQTAFSSQMVNFTSNGASYTSVSYQNDSLAGTPIVSYGSTVVFDIMSYNGWENEAYKTIDFGSTEQEVSDEFYTWLTANATRQADEEDGAASGSVTITYNGSVISSMSAGQTATLHCNGKKMAGDIVITVQ